MCRGHLQRRVDVPNVNTLFFFRPTESATVFLQQFGRGLRRARGKAELVVFDLTGRQHLQFRFDRRLRSLLGHTPRELTEFVSKGFGRLPAGCHLSFDEQAQEDVLAQMRRAIPSDQAGIRARCASLRMLGCLWGSFFTRRTWRWTTCTGRIARGGSCGTRRASTRESSARKRGSRSRMFTS